MPRWLVQQYVPTSAYPDQWRDISPRDGGVLPSDLAGKCWEAEDAGQAFRLAVLDNPDHQINQASYRVLPYEGGATFNVSINLEATEHKTEAAHV